MPTSIFIGTDKNTDDVRISVRHPSHARKYPNKPKEGMTFTLSGTGNPYHYRAYNEKPDGMYDYRDLDQRIATHAWAHVTNGCVFIHLKSGLQPGTTDLFSKEVVASFIF